MKTQRSIIGAFLLVVLSVGIATGQVPVRRVEDVGALEKVSIVLERAFVPGLKILAPLHAYDGTIICNSDQIDIVSLAGEGWAAIVLPESQPLAYFHESVSEAQAVAMRDWCDSETSWQFATPTALPDVEPVQRYFSRDIERIAEEIERIAEEPPVAR